MSKRAGSSLGWHRFWQHPSEVHYRFKSVSDLERRRARTVPGMEPSVELIEYKLFLFNGLRMPSRLVRPLHRPLIGWRPDQAGTGTAKTEPASSEEHHTKGDACELAASKGI
jgi:hypothetical protein